MRHICCLLTIFSKIVWSTRQIWKFWKSKQFQGNDEWFMLLARDIIAIQSDWVEYAKKKLNIFLTTWVFFQWICVSPLVGIPYGQSGPFTPQWVSHNLKVLYFKDLSGICRGDKVRSVKIRNLNVIRRYALYISRDLQCIEDSR